MVSGRNRHATHPVNAMLNCVHAVLESQVRIATISQGLDPEIGYLHISRPGRTALVYDLMDSLRSCVDCLILDVAYSQTFSPRDLVFGANGVCRLHPRLSRQMIELSADERVVEDVGTRMIEMVRGESTIRE
jgi:CRISPR-associated protein Cas1